jgi:hypothetical protein
MVYVLHPNYMFYYLLSCIHDFIIAPSFHYHYILLHLLLSNMWLPKNYYVRKRKHYCRRWYSRGNKRRNNTTKWKKNKKNNHNQFKIILTTDTQQCHSQTKCQKLCQLHDQKRHHVFLRNMSPHGMSTISSNLQLQPLQGIADNSPSNPQDPMTLISLVSTRTSITRPQLFEPDSHWIGLDTFSTYCLTNDINDFTIKHQECHH